MTIDKLSGINPLQQVSKTNHVVNKTTQAIGDTVEISDKAKVASELYHIAEQVRLAPDIREDRVNEVLAQIKNDPNFFSKEKIEAVAKRIAEFL